ncbi:unnamed protein product [Adineta steineri]|uniref:Methyltransferase FkbM domain-containing protein n=1 Tax=Adineta steineri TaxID=433720 RepID=A0A814K2W0_9BILA|nr:unnamed protein product [Adineta steineri]
MIRTTICVHPNDYISDHFVTGDIYENKDINVLFRILWQYPNIALIDIGANIGTYTMFAAAMGRLVIAIECFEPNYMRIAKAVQIENLHNKVILIGNAVYSKSGQYVTLTKSPESVASQELIGVTSKNQSVHDPYIVTTIQLDDILSIIKQTKFRSFAMKIDIEGSEYYVFESGKQIFDYVDIPIIVVEWVFNSIPTNKIRKFVDVEPYKEKSKLKETDPKTAHEKCKQIQGFIVEFPIDFLADDMTMPKWTTSEGMAPISLWT